MTDPTKWQNRFVPTVDHPDAAFKLFCNRIGNDRPYWVYRLSGGFWMARRSKLTAINRAPDNRVWLFKRTNEKPIQLTGELWKPLT